MSPYSSHAEPLSSPVPVIVTVILLVFSLFGFLTLFFCRCILENLAGIWNGRRNPPGAVTAAAATEGAKMSSNGLDPELIQAFPTFYYSTVNEFRCEKYGLECAICFGGFNDDDMLRLLTICCHVFHKDCVDLWLESHKTCPVCRGELDLPRKSFEKSPILVRSNSMHEIGANQSSVEDAVCIDIKDDNSEKADAVKDETHATSDTEKHRKRDRIERFPRSHSTGHSISKTRELDRNTLKLPDHVKIKIVRGHNSARSCIVFGEFTSLLDYRNGGSGEASEPREGGIDKKKKKKEKLDLMKLS